MWDMLKRPTCIFPSIFKMEGLLRHEYRDINLSHLPFEVLNLVFYVSQDSGSLANGVTT